MVQWVKDPTAAAPVSAETWVQSLAPCSRLKDPVLPQLQLIFNPWPRSSICCGCGHKIKKQNKIKQNPQSFSLFLFADMNSKIELPMIIHEEVHFKTLSSENNDENSKTSLDTERSTMVEIDTSVENTLPNSQIFSTDYSLSSQNYLDQKGKKQVICSLMQQLRKKLDAKVTSYQVLTYFYL